MVEPHKGHEVAYNRWYERDHFYAGCMIGAWNITGARFVATKECKAKRYPADSPICPDPTSGSYLAVYWILAGKFGEWIQWGTNQVNWLHANGRMFQQRDHVHTLMYKYRGEVHATRRRRAGRARARPPLPRDRARDRRAGRGRQGDPGDRLGPLPPAARRADQLVTFTPIPLLGDAPSDVPRDEAADRFLHAYFVDGDPVAQWDQGFASSATSSRRPASARSCSRRRSSAPSPAPTPTPTSSGSPACLLSA